MKFLSFAALVLYGTNLVSSASIPQSSALSIREADTELIAINNLETRDFSDLEKRKGGGGRGGGGGRVSSSGRPASSYSFRYNLLISGCPQYNH